MSEIFRFATYRPITAGGGGASGCSSRGSGEIQELAGKVDERVTTDGGERERVDARWSGLVHEENRSVRRTVGRSGLVWSVRGCCLIDRTLAAGRCDVRSFVRSSAASDNHRATAAVELLAMLAIDPCSGAAALRRLVLRIITPHPTTHGRTPNAAASSPAERVPPLYIRTSRQTVSRLAPDRIVW